MANTVQFEVSIKGENTSKTYSGIFEVKTNLSLRDSLREDQVRRNTLGTNPGEASDYATSIAGALAYLAVRIVNAPDFWAKSNGGVDLEDENVLVEVNNACVKAIQDERDKVKALATDAQKVIATKAAGA
jgi:hypothetical protein